MTGLEKPEDEASGPRTDRNPGTLGTDAAAVASGARSAKGGDRSPSSDTLLSAPTPATREDLALDERLTLVERKLEEQNFRLESLEKQPQKPRQASEVSFWPWFVFLAALALAWQILALFR